MENATRSQAEAMNKEHYAILNVGLLYGAIIRDYTAVKKRQTAKGAYGQKTIN
jgi:hypothetical protein